eukprot:CAMPEP_0202898704 /NCGR_PEP_ID=MMETSP1392-20130828/7155_1 /ASSEMBLY_ACC=CAM_ASM_000868 /TAXON_ID=225041 /ORGANISM="Chlamydomonas chlamydogama, Strain SAG 11-48b" /LENGTH=176 /DNA_ID=CAMNT_0049584707 /DNA_START=81 /DNA_END=611 /DNA_ORIENTATION=-
MLSLRSTALPVRAVAARSSRCVRTVVCRAQNTENDVVRKAVALPLASMVAAALVAGAVVPDEALAAKSSGRVSGSSGFSSRKVQKAAPSTSTTVNNTTVVMAPPVYSPPMFSPFGFSPFGGFSIMPTFVMPVPFLGGILQFMFLAMIASVIFGVIRGIASSASSSQKKKDDGWGDL